MAKREVDLGPIIDMESIWIRLEEMVTEKINEMMEEYAMAGITSEQLEESKTQIIESFQTMLGEYQIQTTQSFQQLLEDYRMQDEQERQRQREEDWRQKDEDRRRDEEDRQRQMDECWQQLDRIMRDTMMQNNETLRMGIKEDSQGQMEVISMNLQTSFDEIRMLLEQLNM